jgi:hypothetical protein
MNERRRKNREWRIWLKKKQEQRRKFEGISESLEYLKNNTDITKIITKDGTNKTEGNIFGIDDLIIDYKRRGIGISKEIQDRIKKEEG